MGPNAILDKGFYVDPSSAAVSFGLACKFKSSTSQGDSGVVGDTVTSSASAGEAVLGIYQETLDAAKVSTGKATVSVRIMGITRMVGDGSGTAITPGMALTVNGSGQAVAVASSVGLKQSLGIAMSPLSVAGGFLDVLLTPFGTVNTAVS